MLAKFLEAVKTIDDNRVMLCHYYCEILSVLAYNPTFSAIRISPGTLNRLPGLLSLATVA